MYLKDYREIFEDIANLMFCTELDIGKGVNRRINQRAIESDPVLIDGKRYAYQAKYYDASTKLSARKQDFITCVKGAASRDVTDLFLYINKNLPDTDSDTGEEAGYIREIERVASQHSIVLYWHTLSMIETSLDMPKYAYIKNLYFEKNIKEYYDFVVKLYKNPNTGNTLLGEESLAELYMQPSYYKSNGETGHVEQLLDEFISKGDHGVLWLVGEPGHGKTSMCIKAVADYRSMKRYQQAKGVFWFRLNPQGIPEMVKTKMLALEKVFSWGRIVRNRTNMIEPSQIEGSLVFLDGFDELKSSLEEHDISSNQFYEQVNQLAQEYQMHIVVTSRTRALEQEDSCKEYQLRRGDGEITCNLSDGGVLKNNVLLLSPLTEEKQNRWINELISLRENKGIDTSDLRNYKHTFHALQRNKDIAGLLKVPILLRMIVQNCFKTSSNNRVNLYHDLFDKTLLRQGLEGQQKRLRSIYQEIAFRIFVFDDDCAELNKAEFNEITDNDACLYQYYLHMPEDGTKQDKTNIYRITFLHRSFYQYFLSEFFYEKLKSVTDGQDGENFLKYLWPRHMDPYVLDNLRLRAINEDIDYMLVFKAIDKTDAFLSEYVSDSQESIGNYDKANNVFWNAISACNRIFNVEASQKKRGLTGRVIELLSKYTCYGIVLRNSFLRNAKVREANLRGANLSEADLSLADLSGANLNEAILCEADLTGANLSGANLIEADLRRADLSGADLSGANLNEAILCEADLTGANLSGAQLSRANLSRADLRKANLSEADLSEADLRRADLRRADLRRANLSEAYLSKANLSKAYLSLANLSGADLSVANQSLSVLSLADLDGVDLDAANLDGAVLSLADLNGADKFRVNLSLADLSGANLNEADLSLADLNGADLSGANLIEADLRRADLSGADLSGANLSDTDLSGADLNGAFWGGAMPPETKS